MTSAKCKLFYPALLIELLNSALLIGLPLIELLLVELLLITLGLTELPLSPSPSHSRNTPIRAGSPCAKPVRIFLCARYESSFFGNPLL